MNRRGTGDEIRALFKKLRERIPGLVLRTSLIAGLPGEDEAAFEELCEFLREARIERVGVFPFSPEEGTPAAKMEHVDFEEAQRRADLILALQAPIMEDFCQSLVGKTLDVLCEGFDEESGLWVGRSWADSPEIDGQVLFDGPGREGEIQPVTIESTEDGLLCGHLKEGEQ
jgi:ribosomal protein S12 methylthiotransferase